LQYSREIAIESDSPEIRFHAIMKNSASHPIQWSVQSVTQYDTSDPKKPGGYNRDFWAFTPAKPSSAHLDSYHVRSGLADDPSFGIDDGLFCLHWLPVENEVWLDSTAGWLAVVDASSQYGMIEHFRYFAAGDYPGKATVIFYKNGSAIQLSEDGYAVLTPAHPQDALRYMEAELNSPIVNLAPGQTYAMDTTWHPVRISHKPVSVADPGACTAAFEAIRKLDSVRLRGSFSVFFPGHLEAWFFDAQGAKAGIVSLVSADPASAVELLHTVTAPANAAQIMLHLIGSHGEDRGALATVTIAPGDVHQ